MLVMNTLVDCIYMRNTSRLTVEIVRKSDASKKWRSNLQPQTTEKRNRWRSSANHCVMLGCAYTKAKALCSIIIQLLSCSVAACCSLVALCQHCNKEIIIIIIIIIIIRPICLLFVYGTGCIRIQGSLEVDAIIKDLKKLVRTKLILYEWMRR